MTAPLQNISADWQHYSSQPNAEIMNEQQSFLYDPSPAISLTTPIDQEALIQPPIPSQRAEELLENLERSFRERGKATRAAQQQDAKRSRGQRPKGISDDDIRRLRDQLASRATSSTSNGNPIPVSGPILAAPAYRSQLRTKFDETFFPRLARGGGALYPYYGFNLLGDDWGAAVEAAGDAMCVLQLGVQFRHREMLLAFHSLYARALTKMRQDLQTGKALRQPDDTMCAATLLTICEGIISSSYDSASYNTHLRGLLDFLTACGPDVLNSTEKRFTDAAWFHNWRMMALGYGLGARRRLIVEDKAWQRGGAAVDPLSAKMLRVPGWLEDLDKLAADRTPLAEFEPIFARAVEFGAEMREQIIQFSLMASKKPGASKGPPYVLVPVKTFPHFASVVGDQSHVVPEVYLFSDMISAGLHKNYWTGQLLLNQSLLDLRVIYPSLLTDDEVIMLEAERDECVASLCRCIAFFAAPAMGSVGLLGVRGPIHFTTLHYARFSDEKKLRWCQRVADGVVLGSRVLKLLAEGARESTGNSPPNSKPSNSRPKVKNAVKQRNSLVDKDRVLGGTEMQSGRWKELPLDIPPSHKATTNSVPIKPP
ncbi:Hypothetical protein R9X50_00151600 [Acrodontium crateriforme]|uniref:Uncharacterized protein n=1 Tax=Acrodontium crateriforme TaxID=150365 RepID=A0AAQ3RA49_9PEZI|nr:Hypothetical protein R9X50_00151600 [Acrodontium crateriforme]